MIARTELRRRWRALLDEELQFVATLLVVLLFGTFSLFGPVAAFGAGLGVRSGDAGSPIDWVRLALVTVWLILAGIVAYRGYANTLRPDRLDGMLTTVSPRELLGGVVLAEGLTWGGPAVAYGLVLVLAFAVGAGSPLAIPAATVALLATVVTAVISGFLLALAVRNAGVRSPLLTRLRTPMFAVLAVGYVWVFASGSFDAVFGPILQILEPTPVGWLADLAMVGTDPDASAVRGVGAIVVTAVYVLGMTVTLPRLAAWLWYADGVHVERGGDASVDELEEEGRLTRLVSRPVVGVAVADWKRARRAPITLSFVLYPLIVLINPIATVVQTGTVGGSFPLWIVLCGAWVTGAAFTLNVVGNEGGVLPTTVLSADPGRALVVGHTLAGVGLFGTATIVATVVLGIASPHPSTTVATLTLSAVVLVACAGPLATGIGTVFPRLESVTIGRNTEAIVPSNFAFAGYSIVLLGCALPAILAHTGVIGGWLASAFGTPVWVVGLGGTAVTALLVGTGAVLSARHAIGAVESHRLE
ncbi:hypothetical protein B1756_11080 [Natrarchaeobaculum aegyptiacum]|uniref:Uncharacterized protein n=1 Tax=Natrarchaeobaculum aegyptiacum TaxID=745377 RepID=A0A2Z2HX27_9EURY|nr:hypothetical protein B1756_11080 [Natrarchaeobaculum aegyptiacum]